MLILLLGSSKLCYSVFKAQLKSGVTYGVKNLCVIFHSASSSSADNLNYCITFPAKFNSYNLFICHPIDKYLIHPK